MRKTILAGVDRLGVLGGLVIGALAMSACGGDEKPPPQTPAAAQPTVAAGSTTPTASSDTAAPSAATAPAKPPMAETQLAMIKGQFAAISAHDGKKFASFYTENAVVRPAGGPDLTGREAVAGNLQRFFDGFPDFQCSPGRVFQKGNIAAIEWGCKGTNTSSLMGQKATQRPAGVSGMSVQWYNDDGLVKEEHGYWDMPSLMSQLDAKAKPGTFRPPASLPSSMEAIASKGTSEEDKNIQAVKALYASLDNKKEADFLALITDDTTIEDYSQPAMMKGKKDAKTYIQMFTKAFPDFTQTVSTQFGAADYVVNEGTLNGTHKGPLGPMKASNKPVTLHFVDIWQIKDGKVVKGWSWSNGMELMQQISPQKQPGGAAAEKPAAPAPAGKAGAPAPKSK